MSPRGPERAEDVAGRLPMNSAHEVVVRCNDWITSVGSLGGYLSTGSMAHLRDLIDDQAAEIERLRAELATAVAFESPRTGPDKALRERGYVRVNDPRRSPASE